MSTLQIRQHIQQQHDVSSAAAAAAALTILGWIVESVHDVVRRVLGDHRRRERLALLAQAHGQEVKR